MEIMVVEDKLKQKWKKEYTSKFDIDLKFGEGYEYSLANILTMGKIEVKTERDTWKKTGNVAIELASRGKLSGLNTTEADWWVHILTIKKEVVGVLMFPVKKLKKIVKRSVVEGNGIMKMGGDDETSELALIPLGDLTNGF
jgi:hypothetical protein